MAGGDDFSPLNLLGPGERAAFKPARSVEWREPMLATLTDRRFSDHEWLFEPKLDGVRAVVVADGSGPPTLWTRNHNPISYPHIAEALAGRGPERFVADGELVAFEGHRTSFAALRGRDGTSPVFLYLFDLLVVGEVDLTDVALRCRKQVLEAAFGWDGPVRFCTHRDTDGEDFYRAACEQGWEGLVAKRAASPYRPGRSRDWLKFKCVVAQELVIGGWTEPKGSRTGFGALLVGYYDGGDLRYAGKVGTGFNDALLADLRRRLDALAIDESPFADAVREKAAHWARPELVAQVGFHEWTDDGKLRHPRFEGLRPDKAAGDVVRERPGQ